ncbi:MAG: ATPase [Actinobacteria bacterium HGW-Actinobacteria-10]|nr:MAG: ATPase [Actinobacteria bacterium HGW-Actinobacteria-10]
MNSTLELLLDEQRDAPLPQLTHRDIRVPRLDSMATVLVGMRRVGKSYLLYQEMRRALELGVPRSSILSLNLEDDRLGTPGLEVLNDALEYLFRTGPDRHEHPGYLFLDEIQTVPGWEQFVVRVLNTENVRVYATGSSAKLLSTEIATGLRGRSTAVEVLPFSFREHLRHTDLEHLAAEPVGAAARSRLEAAFDEYLRVGGFPGVISMETIDRRRTLQDYVELVTFRDVVERWDAANLVALKWLIGHLLSTFSREFSVNRVYNDMKSQGIQVGRDTLHAYLDHLVDARLLHTVSIRRASYRARQINPRKVYAVDPGLAAAVAHPSADDTGHLLENTVYIELRRRYSRLHDDVISYFSSEAGNADFVVDSHDGPVVIQVCSTLQDTSTADREIRGAVAAMVECGTREATIVTLHEHDRLETEAGTIDVVPAWRWMLRDPGDV